MKNILILLVTIFFFEKAVLANPMTVTSGEVKFTAVGKPGFLKIRGESKGHFPKGTIKFENNTASGEFEFDLGNLETGIQLRDEHMKDKYLEVGKYPTAKFILKPIQVKESELSSDFKKSFIGMFTLHGVTKEVQGEFTFHAKEKNLSALFTLKMSDFKIDIPTYKIVTVGEIVDLEISLNLK